MHVHPFFNNLILHSNNELSEILGKAISSRKTIHEWPLSCVQQIILEDGSRLIYKTQLPPSVEVQFYETAKTSLLPKHRVLGSLGRCQTMTLEWIEAPLLSNLVAIDEHSLLEHSNNVIAQIKEIKGYDNALGTTRLPVFLDIGSTDAWQKIAAGTLHKLSTLIQQKFFQYTDADAVAMIRTWAQSQPVLNVIYEEPRLIHGDLKADQIFVTKDGYRVIDWQRPVIAPAALDLVSLLVEQHVEPCKYVSEAMAGLYWFLRLHWAVIAQADLFAGKRWPLFDQWAKEAVTQLVK